MRSIAPFIFLSVILLSGCESAPQSLRERFSPVPPKIRQFDGDLRTVYTAAQLAFKRLDFVLTDSSDAPSRLEAASRITSSEALGDSRQLVANLQLHEIAGGRTEVALLLSLQVETGSRTGSSAQNQREHGFYETFFTTLQQVLQEKSAGNPNK